MAYEFLHTSGILYSQLAAKSKENFVRKECRVSYSTTKEMNATTVSNPKYMKGFIPFAIAGGVLSLCGGFTASVPPTIANSWGLGGDGTTWITLAYALSVVGMAPIMGKLSDLFGRRTAILIGTGLFGLGELLIGVCPAGNFLFMIVARLILGCGGATIAPAVVGYILTEFPSEKQGKGFSIYMFISAFMVVFGPTLGGIMIDSAGWRPVLYLCVAFNVIAFLTCFFLVEKQKRTEKGSAFAGFDGLGAVFVFIFFALFMCVPTFGQSYGWLSRSSMICITVAAIALVFLLIIEKRAKNPILNGKFMVRRQFVLPVIILFLTQGLMQSCMTNMILFVLATQHTTTLSGIATSLLYLGMSIGAIVIGPMADKKEPRTVAAGALVFVVLGAAMQLLFHETTGITIFGLALFLIGLGLGGNATIFMKVALSGIPPALAGVGSGTYNMFRDMSGPFGVAVFVPMFSSDIQHALRAGVNEIQANVEAMHSTAMVQIVCVIAGIAACFLIPKIYAEHRQKE